MKRGAFWLVALLALAITLPSVCADNATVSDVKKSPGQSWTMDGHNLSIILREQKDASFIYLSFDGRVEGIHTDECASFGNYRACLGNSTLGPAFDPELRTTPYIYDIHVTALTAGAGVALTVEKTKLLVGEETKAELRIQSNGDLAITDMVMTLTAPTLLFSDVTTPCRLVDNVILFTDPLQKDDEAICRFTLSPQSRNITVLRPTLNFSDGRTRQFKSDASVNIDASTSVIGIRLANTSMPLGSTVYGMVDINNTDETSSLSVSGGVSAQNAEVIGLGTFSQRLGPKTSVGLPFTLRLTRTGNITATVSATAQLGTAHAKMSDSASVRVSFPPLVLKYYGQLALAQPGPASIQIEAENRGDLPLHNVMLTFHPPDGMTMPLTSKPIDILAGRNEQLYVQTITVPFNDVIIPIPINITLTTDLGENLTLNANLTLRTGKAAKTLTPPPAATQKQGTTTATPSAQGKTTTASNTSQPATQQQTQTTPAAQAAAQKSTMNTMLFVITIALVAGAIFWFLSMAAMGRGGKKAENELE